MCFGSLFIFIWILRTVLYENNLYIGDFLQLLSLIVKSFKCTMHDCELLYTVQIFWSSWSFCTNKMCFTGVNLFQCFIANGTHIDNFMPSFYLGCTNFLEFWARFWGGIMWESFGDSAHLSHYKDCLLDICTSTWSFHKKWICINDFVYSFSRRGNRSWIPSWIFSLYVMHECCGCAWI